MAETATKCPSCGRADCPAWEKRWRGYSATNRDLLCCNHHQLAAANERAEKLAKVLAESRLEHRTDDSIESSCSFLHGLGCDCGAEEHNAKIDAALAAFETAKKGRGI